MSAAGDGDQYGVTADDTAETTIPKLYAALEKAEARLDKVTDELILSGQCLLTVTRERDEALSRLHPEQGDDPYMQTK